MARREARKKCRSTLSRPRKYRGLLDLPPELRNYIYSMVCEDLDCIQVVYHKSERIVLLPHALARSSRQLRAEFLDLFWTEAFTHTKEIVCHTSDLRVRELGDWLWDWLVWRLESGITMPKFVLRTYIDAEIDDQMLWNAAGAYDMIPWFYSSDGLRHREGESFQVKFDKILVNIDNVGFDAARLESFIKNCADRKRVDELWKEKARKNLTELCSKTLVRYHEWVAEWEEEEEREKTAEMRKEKRKQQLKKAKRGKGAKCQGRTGKKGKR